VSSDDNIKKDLNWMGFACLRACVHYINLAQDRDKGRSVVKAVMNIGVP
jgi:hypothetical protein